MEIKWGQHLLFLLLVSGTFGGNESLSTELNTSTEMTTTIIGEAIKTSASSPKQTTISTTSENIITTSSRPPVGDLCENGGYFVGKQCVCPTNFYGNRCEFLLNDIRNVEVTVKLTVTVTVNGTFEPDLQDPTSQKFNDFENNFLKEIKAIYTKILRIVGIKILSIRPGSIVVEHDVLFLVQFKNITEEKHFYFQLVAANLQNVTCTGAQSENIYAGAICFKKVEVATLEDTNLTEICSRMPGITEEVHKYYSGIHGIDMLLCVTNCSVLSDHFLDCHNGQCSTTNKGPQCYCQLSDQYWYTGSQCQTAISKSGVTAGSIVALLIILSTFMIMVCIVNKRNKEHTTSTKESSSSTPNDNEYVKKSTQQ